MPVEKISVSMPAEILSEIDRVTAHWFTNRSQAIVRIFQEWKHHQLNTESLAGTGLSNDARIALVSPSRENSDESL